MTAPQIPLEDQLWLFFFFGPPFMEICFLEFWAFLFGIVVFGKILVIWKKTVFLVGLFWVGKNMNHNIVEN